MSAAGGGGVSGRASAPTAPTAPTAPATGGAAEARAQAVRGLARNAAALLLAYVFPRLFTLVSVVVAARVLGAGDFGAYGTAAAFAVILSVASSLGMVPLLVRDIARDPEAAPGLVRAAHGFKTVAGVVMLALLVGLARALGYPPEVTGAALMLGVGYWIASYADNLAAYFQGVERMRVWTEASAAFGLVSGALGVALVLLTRSVVWFAAGFLAGQAAALLWLLYRAPAEVRWGAATAPGDTFRLARATLPFAAAFVALTVHYKVDVLLLDGLRTPEEVGLYAAAYKFVDVFHALVLVGVGAMYPRLSRAAGERGEGRWAATRAAELVLLGAVPAGAVLWLARESVVTLLFGAGYAGAVPVLTLLAPVLPALAVNLYAGYVLGAERRMGWVAFLYGSGLVLKVGLALWAIPRWGGAGAAGAVLAGESILALAFVAVLGRIAGAAPSARMVALAGAAAALAAPVAWWVAPLGGPAAAATYLVLAGALYRLSGALSGDERRAVKSALLPARRPWAPAGSVP